MREAMSEHRFVADTDVQHRFFELRYEGDRRIVGTALRYGDVAELPWGDKERFVAGAFGSLNNADVVLNVQHDRGRLIGRTGGGGLTLMDNATELRVEAILPDTIEANDTLTLVKAKVLRGLSIEFKPDTARRELEDGSSVLIIEKATLRGVAVVDRPAYKKSTVQPRSESEMDEKQIKQIVQSAVSDALSSRADKDSPIDQKALTESISTAVTTAVESVRSEVKDTIDTALKARDDAQAVAAKAEEDRKAAETKAEEDRESAEELAETRADLLVLVDDLLPEGTETRGKSNKDLLVLAVGKEVADSEKRSEDYLLAKVEEIAVRRDSAGVPAGDGTRRPVSGANVPAMGGVSIHRMVEARNQKLNRTTA